MPEKTSPFVESKYGWNYGESGWNTGTDENFVKFGFLHDSNIDGIVSSLPTAVNGTAYFNTTDNRVYFVVDLTYYSTPIPKWFELKIRSTGQIWYYDGSSLVEELDPPTLTAEQIKVLYESNPNTNAFQDSNLEALNTLSDIPSDLANTSDPAKGAALIGHMGRNLSQRLTDVVWGQDHGLVMTGATGSATNEASAIMAAIASSNNKPIYLSGSALRASFSSIADANTLLDNMYRLYVNAGQLSASRAELADVRIDLPAGKITRSNRVRIRGSQHPQLQLRGAPRIPLTFVSATRSWISTTETIWNVIFSDASQVSVGDFIACTDVVGTARASAYNGFWQVTAVSGNTVSLRVTVRANSFSITFSGGTFEKVPTIIEFDNSLGIQVSGDWMGSSNTDAGLVDIGLVSINSGPSQNGIYMERNAYLSGLRVCINGFGSHGYYGLPGSYFECQGFSSNNNAGHGAYPLSGAYIGIGSSTAGLKGSLNGNALYGLAVSVNSTGTATGISASGNGTAGIFVDDNSTLIGANMLVEINGLNGSGLAGGGITGSGDAVLSVEGTTCRFNNLHSIRLNEGAQASLGNGTYNGSLSGMDIVVDDSRSFYTTTAGVTLGTIPNNFVTNIRKAEGVVHTFGSVPANSQVAGPTVTIPGITNSMVADVSSNVVTLNIDFKAKVTAPDTVTIYATNCSTAPITVGARTFYPIGFLTT